VGNINILKYVQLYYYGSYTTYASEPTATGFGFGITKELRARHVPVPILSKRRILHFGGETDILDIG